ncbi:helix-turn-helix domain-containing protein [Clostridium sp. JNZ X4-2]
MIKINHNKFLLEFARSEMTTTELKEKSGVGRNTISRIINGDCTVRPLIIGKLAKALNVDVEQIIDIK